MRAKRIRVNQDVHYNGALIHFIDEVEYAETISGIIVGNLFVPFSNIRWIENVPEVVAKGKRAKG